MSDDFGTVNVRRGDRAREIEVLRQHYRTHRDALGRMIADAPTEQLATEYQRLVASIDDALRKLDELEGRPGTLPGTGTSAARVVVPPTAAAAAAAASSAGTRPLSSTAPPPADPVTEPMRYDAPAGGGGSRTAIIIVVGVLVLAAIGYLIWRASSDRRGGPATSTVVEQPVTTAPETAAPVTAAPTAAAGALKVTPALQDYGVIRKGTRAVRQFEATNGGSTPIEIQVARSACRCLFYEYKAKIAPGGKERITVTVDGGKAKAGALDEQLAVTVKNDPSTSATVGVRAVIK